MSGEEAHARIGEGGRRARNRECKNTCHSVTAGEKKYSVNDVKQCRHGNLFEFDRRSFGMDEWDRLEFIDSPIRWSRAVWALYAFGKVNYERSDEHKEDVAKLREFGKITPAEYEGIQEAREYETRVQAMAIAECHRQDRVNGFHTHGPHCAKSHFPEKSGS